MKIQPENYSKIYKVKLTKGIYVHPSAEVAKNAKIGKNTFIWNQVQIRRGAIIGKNCIFGKDVYIDLNVKIGNNVKIQNRVSVYAGVKIEDDVFLGPHMTFTNDRFPRSFNPHYKILHTLVRKGASVGASATIVCGVTIGEYAMIGAGAIVTKDVPPHALAVGNPARVIGFVCKCGRRLQETKAGNKHVAMRCKKCNDTYNDLSLTTIL